MKTVKHKTCENHNIGIDWNHTNEAGLPAMVCTQCAPHKKSKRKQHRFICWISKQDLNELYKSDLLDQLEIA